MVTGPAEGVAHGRSTGGCGHGRLEQIRLSGRNGDMVEPLRASERVGTEIDRRRQ
jgi:hypothetical protein